MKMLTLRQSAQSASQIVQPLKNIADYDKSAVQPHSDALRVKTNNNNKIK